ncbi:glycogen/starch/alpha-glucan phosphorylase [Pontiella agarivorans]|uniref:Alpha-1,4 glucan phosphorylase n=1 Tax=Pontiella agarivorans TaxID=3038953 RepID=A0ABU5MTV7_9BACT|nr:glycogen/starch/alpha-glucan phosphorylase [Pontiella agarivorans]MDZ8117585.1 glycogen/starch/alpha-glucan phosphorylase [Pontiella agarivorans]
MSHFKDNMTAEQLAERALFHLKYSRGKDLRAATTFDKMMCFSHAVRDMAVDGFIATQRQYLDQDVRRVNYLSMEYLIGKMLSNNVYALGIEKIACEALKALNITTEEILALDVEAGLGNGGLGRLAACYLDSLATKELPAYGYGIRYEHGIFRQEFDHGWQKERPDEWLALGYPWELIRPEYTLPVCVYGRVKKNFRPGQGTADVWEDFQVFEAVPYDVPIIGYQVNTVNMLRLWKSQPAEGFRLDVFNQGDYVRAVEEKNWAENVSKVLYPSDYTYAGKELRLIQEYFLASCSVRDIIRRYKKNHSDYSKFAEKNVIQLNDTHPTLAIVELMRVLHDEEQIPWDDAWDITVSTFCYTNHTLLAEALEKWTVDLLQRVLPRHMQIIFEINHRFLQKVELNHPGDGDLMRKVSLIEEGQHKQVRMANLCVIGSNKVNGVSALHSNLLKTNTMPEFNKVYPGKFTNVTNGITHRRWLIKANPELSELISENIGEDWKLDLAELNAFEAYASKRAVQKKFMEIKRQKKVELCQTIKELTGYIVSPDSVFDVQIKRLHMYKRQLLKAMHIIHLYNKIKADPKTKIQPKTFIFAAKAAPAYLIAKSVIKLINTMAEVINNDVDVAGRLKVVFLPDYNVSLAEKIIPAADISEQISTAGLEASGTGNMKLSLNGALTVGTWDGANIEIAQNVGEDNIFIFGNRTEDLAELGRKGYNPWAYMDKSEDLQGVLEALRDNSFDPSEPDLFKDLYNEVTEHGDFYYYLADYEDYIKCNEEVDKLYAKPTKWAEKAILNVARMGWFSSDRSIQDYVDDIWHLKKTPVDMTDDIS